jgi:hypothetical protein
MRRLILAALLALPVALPASAHAAFFPAEVIDGPSSDLVAVGDLDLARDGQGGVVYVKNDGGVPHVFFSRFADGVFAAPTRLDSAQGAASSFPVIGAADNNRLAVAWVNDGNLYAMVKTRDAEGFAAPTLVAAGGVSRPSIDVSINGATYLSWTQNGDVWVARAERDSTQFRVLPAPVDVAPHMGAGDSARKASKVDVAADGSAIVVWGEDGTDGRTHVYARRLFELRLSTAPQDLTLNDVNGTPATGADSPEVDMEDDSSYAQVTFRQNTTAGPRLVMRRLVGSTFDPPVVIDTGLPGARASIDLNGRGEGLLGIAGTGGEVVGETLFNNRISGAARINEVNAVDAQPSAAIGENEDGAVAWFQGTAEASVVRARYFDGVEYIKLADEGVLSRPEFGSAYPAGGLKAASSRAGDVAVVFMQGGPGDRRLVAGFFDKPPTRISGANTTKPRRLRRFAWGNSLNLFGGTKYTVILNGRPIGETTQNELVPLPGAIPDGTHRWQVQITDRRGQTVRSRTRVLRVDNTPPTLRFGVSRKGRMVTVSARAADSRGRLKSGLRRILVDWGDGKLVPMKRRLSKRYGRSGTYRIRVKAVDKAGNETVQTRRVRVTNR